MNSRRQEDKDTAGRLAARPDSTGEKNPGEVGITIDRGRKDPEAKETRASAGAPGDGHGKTNREAKGRSGTTIEKGSRQQNRPYKLAPFVVLSAVP